MSSDEDLPGTANFLGSASSVDSFEVLMQEEVRPSDKLDDPASGHIASVAAVHACMPVQAAAHSICCTAYPEKLCSKRAWQWCAGGGAAGQWIGGAAYRARAAAAGAPERCSHSGGRASDAQPTAYSGAAAAVGAAKERAPMGPAAPAGRHIVRQRRLRRQQVQRGD